MSAKFASYYLAFVLVAQTIGASKLPRESGDAEISSNSLEQATDPRRELRRLSNRVKPYHYELLMKPDLDLLKFEGYVRIDIKIDSTPPIDDSEFGLNRIALHAHKSLKILNATYLKLSPFGNQLVKLRSLSQDDEQGLMLLTLEQNVLDSDSSAQLYLNFSGDLRSDLRGFFKSAYSINGDKRFYAMTQFEPTDARLAFPCFDEPSLKATFNITLVLQADRTALSNMQPIAEELVSGGSWKLVQFAQTPPMSTYLVAFVVGDFDFVERKLSNNGPTIRAYTAPDRSKQGEFALETAVKIIKYLQNYLYIEYPLPKLDLVAVPELKFGAMENWGLIMFSPIAMLIDEERDSLEMKAMVFRIVVHEIAHQWFGNLVTMDWWNDLWLNEGFATWVESIAHTIYPQVGNGLNHVLNCRLPALAIDSTLKAYPISPERVEASQDIERMFDYAAAYCKSASILHTIRNDYLDPGTFQAAVQHYLSMNIHGNVNSDDLWRSMEMWSGAPVSDVMNSWIKQSGYPLIKVNISSDDKVLLLEQKRFISDSGNSYDYDDGTRWMIPATILVSDGISKFQKFRFLMRKGDQTAYFSLPDWFDLEKTGHWLKLNAYFSGFYRAQYPESLVRSWRRPIELHQMSLMDRLNIVDEASALADSNKFSRELLVELLSWFKQENNGAMLEVLVQVYMAQKDFIEPNEFYWLGRNLFEHFYEKYGFNSSEQLDLVQLRGQSAALRCLIMIGHKKVIRDALELFDSSNAQQIDHLLRYPVYLAASKYGSEDQYGRLMSMHDSTESQEERTKLRDAIGVRNQNDNNKHWFN